MIIYEVLGVLDNPLFEGLSTLENQEQLVNFVPKDAGQNYWTWVPVRKTDNWPFPNVEGRVREFNDYPCINLSQPAFSPRAVDVLKDFLEPNGELLPVRHPCGLYYVFNCTTICNCIDVSKSTFEDPSRGVTGTIDRYVLIPEMVEGKTLFRIRPEILSLYCNEEFVNRVNTERLNGFVFAKIWSTSNGASDYHREVNRVLNKAKKIRIANSPPVSIDGNTVLLRLCLSRKRPTKAELAAVQNILDEIDARLYDPRQSPDAPCLGNLEGHDVVDHEVRVFVSAPNCDQLIEHLRTFLCKLPWPGRYYVLKHDGHYGDVSARPTYVRLTATEQSPFN